MSEQQQPQEEPIVIENGFVFYVMRILSMAALQMKYADMITIETKMVNEKKYYFNVLKRKIESIVNDMASFVNTEDAKRIQVNIAKNDEITILENVQIGMMAMNDEDRQKVEDYVYSLLKK
jgi:hypothetical protein